jgi:hypothetical protein
MRAHIVAKAVQGCTAGTFAPSAEFGTKILDTTPRVRVRPAFTLENSALACSAGLG